MKKILHPFDQKIGQKHAAVFITVEFENGNLSISGVVGPNRWGNCRGSAGQIDSNYAHRDPKDNDYRSSSPTKPSELRFSPGWTTKMWLKLLDIWARWHLNDLKAGCEHQRAMGWDKELIDPSKPASQDNMKTWAYPKDGGHLTEPCPVCGYKYGTAWLREEVPADVITWLSNLPDSDRPCPWD